jgi:hypothetical protein
VVLIGGEAEISKSRSQGSRIVNQVGSDSPSTDQNKRLGQQVYSQVGLPRTSRSLHGRNAGERTARSSGHGRNARRCVVAIAQTVSAASAAAEAMRRISGGLRVPDGGLFSDPPALFRKLGPDGL